MILSEQGIALRQGYASDGQVLMGRSRAAREAGDQAEGERLRLELDEKRRQLALREAVINARVQAFQLDLDVQRAALRLLETAQTRQQDAEPGQLLEAQFPSGPHDEGPATQAPGGEDQPLTS